MNVFVVRYSNYYPAEVDSLWDNKEQAQLRTNDLNGIDGWSNWEVSEWVVHTTLDRLEVK